MPKITNNSKTPRSLHIASKGNYVELAKGDSVEATAADLAALKSTAFDALVADGAISVEGADAPADGAAKKAKKGDTTPADGVAQ